MKSMNFSSSQMANRCRAFLSVLLLALCSQPGFANAFSGGSGTVGDPYRVANLNDLNNVRNYQSSCFLQITNIDISSITNWTPISGFTGTYDGQGCAITGLTINNSTAPYQGLFAQVNTGAVLKNIALKNVNVQGYYNTGGLASYVQDGASILNCSVTGTVHGYNSRVGGLLGEVAGSADTILGCTSYATVITEYAYNADALGGVIGENRGTVIRCFSAGPVYGGQLYGTYFFTSIGGFVGSNYGTIVNCYSTGSVSGYSSVGGFIGTNQSGSITNCYSSGTVYNPHTTPYGFCATYNGGTISNSFWDAQGSGRTTSNGGTAATTSAMQTQSTFESAGWDFTGVWTIGGDDNNGYPYLTGVTVLPWIAITGGQPTNVLSYSAVLHGKISTQYSSTAVYFHYGTSPGAYTDSVLADQSPVQYYPADTITASLSGLSRGTTYYYMISGYSSDLGYYRGFERSFTTASEFSGGLGTSADPYLIGDVNDLQAIGNAPYTYTSYYYIQTTDIDASATSGWNGGGGLKPITFVGDYDGQNHSITNLVVRNNQANDVGLFASLSTGHSIKNLKLINVNILGVELVGGLVASNSGSISNCFVSGVVQSDNNGDAFVGGLVGVSDGSGSIDRCASTATVNGAGTASLYVGGLAGRCDGTISNSYAAGAVGDTHCIGVGGFVGIGGGTVTNCYSTGSVSGNYNYGGFAWSIGTATNCFWDKQTSGCAASGAATGKTTAEMKDTNTFINAGWSYSSVWWSNPVVNNGYPQLRWMYAVAPTQPAGDGSQLHPYRIASLGDIYWISLNPSSWGAYFVQTADIDASPTMAWNGGAGFLPIGSTSPYFYGRYDGQNHTITGLYINRPTTDFVGLFGGTYTGVKNLGLINVNITGGEYTGALIGLTWGDSVNNCYSTGMIKSPSADVGGLIGWNSGAGSIVMNSFSACSVNSNYTAGGLVGHMYHGTLSNCYAAGTVSANNSNAGGLIGVNESVVDKCYAVGTVSAPSNAGGLVGYNGSTVTNSFWDISTSGCHTSGGGTGKTALEMRTQKMFTDAGWDFMGESVNGTSDTWGMIGASNSGYPCFVSLLPYATSSTASAVGFAKARSSVQVVVTTTASWTAASDQSWLTVNPTSGTGSATLTFACDSNTTTSSRTDTVRLTIAGTPYVLASVTQTATVGQGTEASPYMISSYDDLKSIGTVFPLSGVFRLAADIDASGSATENSDAGFLPIGNASAPFSGIFHGGGHGISGLHIQYPAMDSVGFFGFMSVDASVDSLGLLHAVVSGRNMAGGVAGQCNGTIRQCFTTGLVTGSGKHVGGLAGYGYAMISTGNHSSASVAGSGCVGGLIGSCSGQVTGSYATGSVTAATTENAGGLIGYCEGKVGQCYATGAVSGVDNVGGLIGKYYSSDTLNNCFAIGRVTSTGEFCGGLCGQDFALMNRCYAAGTVTGSSDAGALCGYVCYATVQNCFWNSDNTSLDVWGYADVGVSTGGGGLSTAHMKHALSFGGWDFLSAWTIRDDSTYPGLRQVSNNPPFAFADTLLANGATSLSMLLQNDCDIERGRSGLISAVAAVYGEGTADSAGTFTASNDEPSDSLLYTVGKVVAPGDTLWGNSAVAVFVNQLYVPLAGSGSELSPYRITTYGDLKKVRFNLQAVYRLTADIDASASVTENGGAGFAPIGATYLSVFSGTFHGGGHKISGLHINRPLTNYIGCFGYAGDDARIDSVGLNNASITGRSYTGGLAGACSGTIDHSFVTGTILGFNWVGGLAGYVYELQRSFSAANVSGSQYIGGLAGTTDGPVMNSYANGSVSAVSYAGGAIGLIEDTMRYCYSTCIVTCPHVSGGLAGGTYHAWIDSSYWRSDGCAAGNGMEYGGTTCHDTVGLTAAQMKYQSNYHGWDFAAVWEMPASGYPVLRSNPDFETAVEQTSLTAVTRSFALNQNYPNPFNPSTTISFTLAQNGFTTLKIYDVLGREVAILVNGDRKAGVINTVTFNASKMSSGVYFSRLVSNGSVQVKKLILMK
jgi:hypothetical protein